MKQTIIHLFDLQIIYLKKLVENIPENRLYEKQLEGFNSAGWLLGHICVEADDIFDHLNTPYNKLDPKWYDWFKNSSGKVSALENLPSKADLLNVLDERYNLLSISYLQLSDKEQNSNHPSKMLRDVFPSVDSWFAHHLTTHIAIHCGNIAVWKKILGIEVNGF